MYRKPLLLLILAVLVIVFASQNNFPVDVRFFSLRLPVSLGAIIFVIFIIGVLLGSLTSFRGSRKPEEEDQES